MAESRDDLLVIGGGVIGLACAQALAEAGRAVRVRARRVLTVIDPVLGTDGVEL